MGAATSLSSKLKAEAMRLGFDLIGITGPEPPPHFDVYRAWIDAGRHAGMAYLATERALERRSDPRRILPSCRSIIVTGTFYSPGPAPNSESQLEVRVAAYAVGEDYHDWLTGRMQALAAFIQGELGRPFEHCIYTDTGPLLERELAQRAGLGWIGKNTCLIHPAKGSYLLLGEILVDLDLEHDRPFASDRCGTCTRCIEACPTGCILPDRTLDSTRCISYLTIEEKAGIPPALRESIGDWFFGCDVCQQVCPWNARFSEPVADPAFQPRPILDPPQLERFLRLQPGSWRREFAGSPLERPRRRGLVRNAAVVAGNRARSDMVESLAHVLRLDSDPMVRSHAAWALGRIGSPSARSALERALGYEQAAEVLQAVRHALSQPDG